MASAKPSANGKENSQPKIIGECKGMFACTYCT